MGFLSVADVLASFVTSAVAAVGGLLCSPLYDKIKASIGVLNAPGSFAADAEKLSHLMNEIKAMRPSDEIERWLPEAEKIIIKVPVVLLNRDNSSDQNHGLQPSCCIFGHGISRCKLHKKVRELIIQGQNIKTCTNLNVETVEHIRDVPNIEDGSTAERNLREVMGMLSNDAVWSIAVYGPGGVGKTTLAKALNNKLKNNSSFTWVRLVALTKDVDEIHVQKAIAEKLGLKVEEVMDTGKTADQIYNRLQREKFVLILDNVWKSMDLVKIGIPKGKKGSKIMLTTRLEGVCRGMEAEAIKIGYLTATEAWQLFAQKAGDVVTDPRIQPLAKVVCGECGGLPLALVAVGSAMKGKTSTHQWQSAIDDLKSSNFPDDDIESQVYKPLKLSFDFLPSDAVKLCFLYCSLYPEGFRIPIIELTWCWLAENIIDEQLSCASARNKGLDLIENLKSSCLLEVEDWDKTRVKMHDVVRDVAVKIARSNGTSIVFSGHGISKSPKIALPQDVENIRWISFVDNDELAPPEYKKDFPKVTTLLIRGKDGVQVPEEFLKGFQALRVLNVRNLESFSHSSLLQLTDLRALLLRECDVDLEELPCGMEKQTNLRELVLSKIRIFKTREVNVIVNFSALEVLDMRHSGYKWPTVRKSESEGIVLEDLSRLKWLKEAYLDLADVEATYERTSWMQRLERFAFYYNDGFSSGDREGKNIFICEIEGNKLGSFILHAERLQLIKIVGSANEIFANFSPNSWFNSKLKTLRICRCSLSEKLTRPIPNFVILANLELLCFHAIGQYKSFYQLANALGTTFPKLRALILKFNEGLENVLALDYPHVVMPELEHIYVHDCGKMMKVFHDCPSETQAVVPKLKALDLLKLDSLESLCSCGSSEHWQSLESLWVKNCPKLKKLPHMPSIKVIEGEEGWWNNLEWDTPETKSYMTRFFKAW